MILEKKRLDPGIDIPIHRLASGDGVALAEIPDAVDEAGLRTVDLLFDLPDMLESRERILDLSKDVDIAFHHLPADPAFGVPLDDDGAAFGVGGYVDVGIAADDDRSAVHERGRIVPDAAGNPDNSALHAAPLTAGR